MTANNGYKTDVNIGMRPCGCADAAVEGEPSTIESNRLFAGRSEIRILHEGQVYRLRVTRNGKLILNK